MTINVDELKKLTGKPVSIVYSSVPKLKGGKKNEQQGRVRKTTNAVVTLGGAGTYGMRKVSEGEYETVAEVKSRAWGVRVGETCVIEHKGALYLNSTRMVSRILPTISTIRRSKNPILRAYRPVVDKTL